MESENIVVEILKQYQKRLTTINEIYRLTQEIEQMLSSNDRVSSQLVLNMRQEEMNQCDKCGRAIAVLEDTLSMGERQRLRQILENENGRELAESFEEKKLCEIKQQSRQILERAKALDKRINTRIAGKDSFYNRAGK